MQSISKKLYRSYLQWEAESGAYDAVGWALEELEAMAASTSKSEAANIGDSKADSSLIFRQISIEKLSDEPKKLSLQQKNPTKIDRNPNDALNQVLFEEMEKHKAANEEINLNKIVVDL